MSEQQQAPESTEAPGLSSAEQAAIEAGQRGFTEPTNVNTPPPQGPQRPEHIPEKFWDAEKGEVRVEALAKSYAELERTRGEQPKEAPQETPKEQAQARPDGKIEKAQGEQEQAPAENPLTSLMEKASAEYSEGQSVTEETIAELAKAGIPPEIMQTYLKGLELITQQSMGEIYSFVEGEENYNQMADWASKTLTDAELEAYNSALDNPSLRENAVRGLYARYSAARPNEGRLVTPQGDTSAAGDVYTDRAQLIADQKDPRYQTDAAFRQSVVDKLQRSQRNGFQLTARPMFEREVFTR